jgi:DNA-binding IclR family transcriptional regulator
MLNELFGPSIHLLVLDMFLENPTKLMNLRAIARKTGKNPGSISRVLPILLKNNFLNQIEVGKSRSVYCLKTENQIVQLIMEFCEKLRTNT